MPAADALTLGKEERICGRKLVERLFNGGDSQTVSAYPLRLVWLPVERTAEEPLAQTLVSVPKRCFKRAVKRNRVKRQVREAYRKHKHLLLEQLATAPDKKVLLAFIWMDAKLYPSAAVEKRVMRLLEIIRGKT